MRFSFILFIILTCFCRRAFGQENEILWGEKNSNDFANYFFDHHLYGAAIDQYNKFISQDKLPLFLDYDKLRRQALIDKGIAGIRINLNEAEHQLKEVIRKFEPEAIVIPAKLELASYYYNTENYLLAIEVYDGLDVDNLPEIEMSEVSFKKGYSHFVNKHFDQAQMEFTRTKELRNEFYYPSNYYLGMVEYFKGDFNGASSSFRKVSNAKEYSPYIPYYISQIYFAQKDYDKLISYAEQKITESNVLNKKEMRLLLGQAYYARGDFERALGHLEYYEANTKQLSVEEFYQLAFTQYKLGNCAKAKENFLAISNEDSRLGQMSNYYLADCYKILGDKVSARTAFKRVSQMNHVPAMQEEALFNYGKLSAELDFEREAINVLVEVKEQSPYFEEAQSVINDILNNSGDFLNSIHIIESLDKLSATLKSTYQGLCLKKGIQSYADNNPAEAVIFLEKALKYTFDRNHHAQTIYWLAQIKNDAGEYGDSRDLLDTYFNISNGINDMPAESAPYIASYVQAYNQLKLKNYRESELFFKNAIVGIDINSDQISNDNILNRILPDAFVRTGDCLFKQNKYDEARKFYNQSISRKQGAFVYSLYQRSLIEGLMGEPYEKIVSLEEILNKYQDSEYLDDAYFQMGETYLLLSNLDKAALSYQDIVTTFGMRSPYYNLSQLKLGLINYNKGDLPKAISYYKAVFEHKPSLTERGEALRALEEIYIQDMGKSAEYLKFVDSLPDLEIGIIARDSLSFLAAESAYLKSEYLRAISLFTEYIASFPLGYFRDDALYFRAESNALQKDFSAALKDYEMLIAEESKKYLHRALPKAAAIAYNFTQDFGKAYRYYTICESALTEVADVFAAQLGALRSSFKLAKEEETMRYANIVIQSKLANIDERASAYYYLGKVLHRKGNFEQAKEAFAQVDKLVSTNQAAESRYLIAEMLFNEKQYSEAEKQCNYINETCLNYPVWVAKSLLIMAEIFIVRNDVFNARAATEAVLENFNDNPELTTHANETLERIKQIEREKNRIKVDTSKTIILDKGGEKDH